MPNWCSNLLVVSGYTKSMEKIQQEVLVEKEDQKVLFDFNTVIEMPKPLREVVAGSDQKWWRVLFSNSEINNTAYTPTKLVLPSWFLEGYPEKICKDFLEQIVREFSDITQEDLEDVVKDKEALANKYQNNLVNFGYLHWYDWSVDNWGTKWNSSECRLVQEKVSVLNGKTKYKCVYQFETAWAPPVPVIEQLSKRYPKLNFKLFYEIEGGLGKDRMYFKKGETL